MAEQRFQLQEPRPGLPGEYVCADCGAPMVMAEPAAGDPAGSLVVTHSDTCEGVKRLTSGTA